MTASVIIVSYHTEHFAALLASALEKARSAQRILVVDTREQYPAEPNAAPWPGGLLWEHLPTNPGYGAACNWGAIRLGDHDLLCFCNGDVLMPAESLDAMARAFEQQPNLGATGPRLLTPQGGWEAPQQDWCKGAVLMVRGELFTRLPWQWGTQRGIGFDERFPHGWEETDLLRRIREAKWAVRHTPDAWCYHFDGLSPNPPGTTKGALHELGKQRYREKWGDEATF